MKSTPENQKKDFPQNPPPKKESAPNVEKLIAQVLNNFQKPENYAVFERLKEK